MQGMDSVMANQVDEKQWYLTVGERSLGPVSTELVARGIRSGKVPVNAWVCQVGDDSWSALSSFGEFQEAIDMVLGTAAANEERASVELPTEPNGQDAPNSEPRQVMRSAQSEGSAPSSAWGRERSEFFSNDEAEGASYQRELLPYERESQLSAPVSSIDSKRDREENASTVVDSDSSISGQREVDEASGLALSAAVQGDVYRDEHTQPSTSLTDGASVQGSGEELGIDITFDEDEQETVDWKERFQSYFLVGEDVSLPEEEKLLQSLRETPNATFRHDEALWNLALCLAFGSEVVAEASANKFYDALEVEQTDCCVPERVEWICRTLLSKGFMPSGIPRLEGIRGIEVLRRVCPDSLSAVFEREACS
jgi:hypothetical protein